MKLVDTNVFLYAVGSTHEYKESCESLIRLFGSHQMEANIDVELLQEILHFFWRRRRLDDGLRMFDSLVATFDAPFSVTGTEAKLARQVFAEHPGLRSRDAIHAAVVLTHGLEGIISADRGFDGVTGVTRFDPLDLV